MKYENLEKELEQFLEIPSRESILEALRQNEEIGRGIEKILVKDQGFGRREEISELKTKANSMKLDSLFSPTQLEKGLQQADSNKNTVYHEAAENDLIHYIPMDYLTPKNLTQDNEFNQCPLDILVEKGTLHTLSKLPPQTLLGIRKELERRGGSVETISQVSNWTKKLLQRAALEQDLAKKNRHAQTQSSWPAQTR
jgi:hypothetical protein